MKSIIFIFVVLGFVSCHRGPYKKVKNISTPSYRTIKKSMKESENYQPKHD
jgi:hypothetical protein